MLLSPTRKLTLVTDENVRTPKTTQRYLYSSRDKEQDGIQFLQIGVTMAKLWPPLNYCEFFMKCIFVQSFYNALY